MSFLKWLLTVLLSLACVAAAAYAFFKLAVRFPFDSSDLTFAGVFFALLSVAGALAATSLVPRVKVGRLGTFTIWLVVAVASVGAAAQVTYLAYREGMIRRTSFFHYRFDKLPRAEKERLVDDALQQKTGYRDLRAFYFHPDLTVETEISALEIPITTVKNTYHGASAVRHRLFNDAWPVVLVLLCAIAPAAIAGSDTK